MKFVSIKCDAKRDALVSMLCDNERTNKNVVFDEKLGRPLMHVKEKGSTLKIKCELTGRASRDNGFLEGTYFKGKIKDTEDGCTVRGIIVTAPIFHGIIIAMLIAFAVQCIVLGGFTPVPLILAAFDIVMFYTEFKKQGIIYRYILRAEKRTGQEIKRTPAGEE